MSPFAVRLLIATIFALPSAALAQPAAEVETEPGLTARPVPREADWWQDRHASFNKAAGEQQWDLVFIGDSITQGWEGAGKEVWQKFYGDRQAGNLGISGDETQHVLWRLENGNLAHQSPKLAVILIGTNNLGNAKHEPVAVIEGVTAIVENLREQAPDMHILLLGVFPRGEAKDDPYRAQIEEVNLGLSKMADWEMVHFLDIGHVFLEDDGTLSKQIMPDFLHLSPEGYQRWAEAIEPKVSELLGEKKTGRARLFDGRSLAGWTGESGDDEPKGWGVKNGLLCVTAWGEDAFTTQQFGDFDFQAEWRAPRKGNGGIFYRVADYRRLWIGPEYQLADDLARGYRPTADNSVGANIDLHGPHAAKPVRPHGEWNHTRIVVVGNHVEHWLNGRMILAYDFGTPDWNDRVLESKFARLHPYFGQPERGKFKLENHVGSRLEFRDILVREL